jgi:hypothetical protein
MMRSILMMFLSLPLATFAACAEDMPAKDQHVSLSPCQGVLVTVDVSPQELKYSVKTQDTWSSSEEIVLGIESVPHLRIDDFNFDGYSEFSVSYLDEGMGTYKVDRVFLFDPVSLKFQETMPSCGDEFLNLVIDRKRHILRSTYFQDGVPKTCMSRPKPMSAPKGGNRGCTSSVPKG